MTTFADYLTDLVPARDYVTINGQRTPGRAIIRGAGTPLKWDERQGLGLTMGLVFTTKLLSKFEIEVSLWEDFHWLQWDAFARLALTKPPSATKPTAMPIEHPILVKPPLAITRVVLEDVSQFEQDDSGLWTCRIKLYEFAPARPIGVVRPLEGPPDANSPEAQANDPLTRAMQENGKTIDRLLTQLKG